MKLFIIAFLFLTANSSFASYNRFWVGQKKGDVSTASFMNGLNNFFFKDTIALGKGKGLLSYQPYIGNLNGEVPDEVALINYESEEKYRAIKNTPEGERYDKSHWDYFSKDNSKSVVAESFAGILTQDAAFELNPSFDKWQKGITYIAIYARTPETDLVKTAEAFSELKKKKEINDSVMLVTQKWIIEYRSLKDKHLKFISLPLRLLEMKRLTSSPLETMKEPVGFGSGMNFIF